MINKLRAGNMADDIVQVSQIAGRIRYIEVVVRKQVEEALSGAYSSVFRGRGIEFDEVREYIPGDDISAIDWNVTARYGRPFTKKFVEERQMNVVLAVDVSSSMDVASCHPSKRELITEICAAIGFSSLRNNDKVSLFAFSSKIESVVLHRRGRRHILRMLREVIISRKEAKDSSISMIVKYLLGVLKKRAVIFLISDFFCSDDFWRDLSVLCSRHDVIAVVVRDELEMQIPQGVGMLCLGDREDGRRIYIDTNNTEVVSSWNNLLAKERDELVKNFVRSGADYIWVTPKKGWLLPFLSFFKRRQKRR